MKKLKVFKLPLATEDIEQIVHYISSDNPKAALGFLDTLEIMIEKLTKLW